MKVIVDTCIWSLAFRRSEDRENKIAGELHNLIEEYNVQMIGPIRQKLLSGIKSKKQFTMLRQHLQPFPDVELRTDDYERAATYFNQCRKGHSRFKH